MATPTSKASPNTIPKTTMTLGQARAGLWPATAPWVVEQLGNLSDESLVEIGPLIFDVIEMENQYLGKEAVKRMIALRPEWIEQQNHKLNTPLMVAVALNRIEIVEMLMGAGAKTHRKNADGLGVLDLAAHIDAHHRWQAAMGEVLLENGEFTQKQKDRAMYYAASESNLGMTRALLAHRAGVRGLPGMGTALAAACTDPYDGSPTEEIVRAILDAPGGPQTLNIGWGDVDQGAAIHWAAAGGKVNVLSVLIEAGAAVNPPKHLRSARPITPLMRAAGALEPEAIARLLEAGADAALIDASGRNALHHLASSSSELEPEVADSLMLQSLDLLIAAGADPLLACVHGGERYLPADTAINTKRPVLAERLIALASSYRMKAQTPVMDPVEKADMRVPRM